MTKTCSKCRETKPDSAFPENGRGGRAASCKSCRNEYQRARGLATLRRQLESPEDRFTRKLWQEYKLTREQYAALVDAQGGACAICEKTPAAGKRLAIDHCHRTGVVRALLCTYCNVVVGAVENHSEAVAEFLAKYGTGHPVLQQ
jgi:hypothetical protein